MGRSLARNESLAHGHYPGCMAGILHILDYHHWHVKKLLPHKKHRHERRNHRPKVIIENRDPDRALADAEESEAESFPVEQHHTKSVPKRRRRARSWILSFSLHSWLQRINPVHHFEPSGDCCDEATIAPNKSEEAKPGECVDFLEIFKENKDFFLKILQDPEACGDHVRGLKNSNIKVRLSKSKSFPAAKFSRARSSSVRASSTLEHKQNEVWFFLDGDKSAVKASDEAEETTLDRGWNGAVVSRFRDMKRKIKHAIDESRRIVEEDASGEVMERLEISIDSHDDLAKRRRVQQRRVRRTSSLNESLDRYNQLFGDAVGRDARLGHSRSLKLPTSEERAATPARKASRRNLSLSDLDSLASLFNVGSTDALRLGMSSFKSGCSGDSDGLKVDENEIQEQLSNEPGRESGASQEEAVSRLSHEAEIESCYSEGFEPEIQQKKRKKKSDHVDESEDFLYVKQILEIFGEEEELTWHSLDQPLSPSLFKQLESYEEEIESGNYEDEDHNHRNHHQLLFDLVNETLGEMSERSYTYFPRPMGLSRAMPKGGRLLEEVWKRTSSNLSMRPELDKSLDDVVARDLAKRDGRWMSLEWEREMVALEIEDLVFDELLDQVLCCVV